jgi:hypothetical protein
MLASNMKIGVAFTLVCRVNWSDFRKLSGNNECYVIAPSLIITQWLQDN